MSVRTQFHHCHMSLFSNHFPTGAELFPGAGADGHVTLGPGVEKGPKAGMKAEPGKQGAMLPPGVASQGGLRWHGASKTHLEITPDWRCWCNRRHTSPASRQHGSRDVCVSTCLCVHTPPPTIIEGRSLGTAKYSRVTVTGRE